MKLYHFTARHHLDGGPGHAGPGILRVGLRPNFHPIIRLPAHVWLTDDPSFAQPWSSRPVPLRDGSVCDRTEVRLTIDLPFELVAPFDVSGGLWRYSAIRSLVRDDWRADFEGTADINRWAVYLASIAPSLIVDVTNREAVAA